MRREGRTVIIFGAIVGGAVVLASLKIGDPNTAALVSGVSPLFPGGSTTTLTFPAAAMEPTINPGQTITFNNAAPCCQRSDIILIVAPPAAGLSSHDGSPVELVSRVIGLPGDTVTTRDGSVYIDGRRLHEPYLPTKDTPTRPETADVPPGCGAPPDGSPGCKIPAGFIFVMGDNRTQAKDSRSYGPLNKHLVRGNAGPS